MEGRLTATLRKHRVWVAVVLVALLAAGILAVARQDRVRDDLGDAQTTVVPLPTPGTTSTPAPTATPTPPAKAVDGASGYGDRLFPGLGNGGYDVARYDLDLTWTPAPPGAGRLVGTATVTMTATARLRSFSLDAVGLDVSAVTVDGRPATTTRSSTELRIFPPRALDQGATATVVVSYAASPQPQPASYDSIGWLATPDGAAVASEPDASRTWFPANDHPRDKAAVTVRMTVPAGRTVVGNGELTATTQGAGTTTYTWTATDPMATYLVTVNIGTLAVATGTTGSGVPVYVAADPASGVDPQQQVALTTTVLDWAEGVLGPYPFTSTGGIFDDVDVGFALETQTRPLYPGAVPETVVVHELAHQWFGDSVGLETWDDLWLNEGFATYVEWLWAGRDDPAVTGQLFEQAYDTADQRIWDEPPGVRTKERLFGGSVYRRGAMALHALRVAVGDADFFTILKQWASTYRHATATTQDLVDLSEKVSGKDLDALFSAWIYTPGRPARP